MKQFNELSQELQDSIKEWLRVYDSVPVFYENGDYSFITCLKSNYAPDHEYIGTYYAKSVFTEEERILNYINVFQAYPIEYNGKRNYKLFHTGRREQFIFDANHNLIIDNSAKIENPEIIDADNMTFEEIIEMLMKEGYDKETSIKEARILIG